MYHFILEETLDIGIQKQFPYRVRWTAGKAWHLHHHTSKQAAEEWMQWAQHVTSLTLPIGITLDIRRYDKPFLARRRKYGIRHSQYFETLHEAEMWLENYGTS